MTIKPWFEKYVMIFWSFIISYITVMDTTNELMMSLITAGWLVDAYRTAFITTINMMDTTIRYKTLWTITRYPLIDRLPIIMYITCMSFV
ncbi:MAG TPA: hypothetical protein VE971_03255, partial [Candidatus Eisenbacteria bacterium]|nr:hypothetical protein [Candidatus Eisenbacteria bacterium]